MHEDSAAGHPPCTSQEDIFAILPVEGLPFDTPAENALIENLMLSKKNYRQMAILQKSL
jgi:hypothetical protein